MSDDPLVRGHAGLTGERLQETREASLLLDAVKAGKSAYLRLPRLNEAVDLALTRLADGRLYYFNPLRAEERATLRIPSRRVESGALESMQEGALGWLLRETGATGFVAGEPD